MDSATKQRVIKAAERVENNWTPVLKGKIYCSSACGGGCTKAAYDNCVKKAKALAKRMGSGWKIRVHENLGWYYSVHKGGPINHSAGLLEITPPHCAGCEYTAWVQSSPQFIVHHKNPKIALREAVALFDEYMDGLNEMRELVDEML